MSGQEEVRIPDHGPRILIVDDDDQIRRLFRRLLTKAGWTASEAASGKEALAGLAAERFDLIVLDLSMPDMDGFDLLRIIHERLPHQKTLVISGAFSGPMTGAMLDIASHLGATAVLEKVMAPSRLVDAVRKALEKP